jgi:hypothetical protein
MGASVSGLNEFFILEFAKRIGVSMNAGRFVYISPRYFSGWNQFGESTEFNVFRYFLCELYVHDSPSFPLRTCEIVKRRSLPLCASIQLKEPYL